MNFLWSNDCLQWLKGHLRLAFIRHTVEKKEKKKEEEKNPFWTAKTKRRNSYNSISFHQTISSFNGLIFLSNSAAFLFLKLNVPQCACKESICGWIWCGWLALHFICDQLNQALDWSNGDLRVTLLKEIEVSADIHIGKAIYLPWLEAGTKVNGQKLSKTLKWLESEPYLFSISTKSVEEPVLPRAAFDICWAAFAILRARFRHIRTLVKRIKESFWLKIIVI